MTLRRGLTTSFRRAWATSPHPEGLLGAKRNDTVARLASLGLKGIAIQAMPRRTWRDEIDDEQIIRWRERAADNRAREVPVMKRALRALGLTLR